MRKLATEAVHQLRRLGRADTLADQRLLSLTQRIVDGFGKGRCEILTLGIPGLQSGLERFCEVLDVALETLLPESRPGRRQ